MFIVLIWAAYDNGLVDNLTEVTVGMSTKTMVEQAVAKIDLNVALIALFVLSFAMFVMEKRTQSYLRSNNGKRR